MAKWTNTLSLCTFNATSDAKRATYRQVNYSSFLFSNSPSRSRFPAAQPYTPAGSKQPISTHVKQPGRCGIDIAYTQPHTPAKLFARERLNRRRGQQSMHTQAPRTLSRSISTRTAERCISPGPMQQQQQQQPWDIATAIERQQPES